MPAVKEDKRYTIALEWCGWPERRYVVRFCGDWVGQDPTKAGAAMIYIAHADKRQRELTQQ